jgi:hypothetical protein
VTEVESRESGEGTRRGAIWESFLVHLEFAFTIVFDLGVILTAVVARWTFLKVLRWFAPADTHTWAVAALEWIGDAGLVAGAATYALFDVLKRVILSYRAFVTLVK